MISGYVDLHTYSSFLATGVWVKIEGYETAKFQEVITEPPDANGHRHRHVHLREDHHEVFMLFFFTFCGCQFYLLYSSSAKRSTFTLTVVLLLLVYSLSPFHINCLPICPEHFMTREETGIIILQLAGSVKLSTLLKPRWSRQDFSSLCAKKFVL